MEVSDEPTGDFGPVDDDRPKILGEVRVSMLLSFWGPSST
jgi:hypothetical protein